MDRKRLDSYINKTYEAKAEYLCLSQPTFAVYRHSNNNKWFAVIMKIPKSKLGFASEESVTVINLKCDPLLIGSLVCEKGIFKGYHMNKNHWITVLLDSSVDDDKIKWLIKISFDLTNKK